MEYSARDRWTPFATVTFDLALCQHFFASATAASSTRVRRLKAFHFGP